ncbi:hypothetical protein [Flavicella sp.]
MEKIKRILRKTDKVTENKLLIYIEKVTNSLYPIPHLMDDDDEDDDPLFI